MELDCKSKWAKCARGLVIILTALAVLSSSLEEIEENDRRPLLVLVLLRLVPVPVPLCVPVWVPVCVPVPVFELELGLPRVALELFFIVSTSSWTDLTKACAWSDREVSVSIVYCMAIILYIILYGY